MSIRRFVRDRRGVAAIEAGIFASVFFLLLLVTLDFAFVFQARVRLAGLLTIGSQYAVQTGAAAVGTDGNAFARRIAAAIALNPGRIEDIDVTLTFNGRSDPSALSDYYCVEDTILKRIGTKAQTCTNGTTAGRFVTIEASGNVPSFFASNPVFDSKIALHDKVTVRVQ